MPARRSYGTGSLDERVDAAGTASWYGRWWTDGRQLKRRVGAVRTPGERDGLTRPQAEAELRRLIADVKPVSAAREGLTMAEVAERYQRHLRAQGRKRTTLAAVESACRVWLLPTFGDRSLDGVRPEDIEDLVLRMRAGGVGAKSVRNYIGTLGAVYRFAMHPRRRWATSNPCDALELPAVARVAEIRFLTVEDVDALATAVQAGVHEQLDRALYITAAMTGLRQGELIALRWRDIDWHAQRVRVRQSHVLGEFGTPKSQRSSRSVPMSTRVAGELDRLHRASRWQGGDDLAFAEPVTGEPLRRGALMRRYRRALRGALLEPGHRFHD